MDTGSWTPLVEQAEWADRFAEEMRRRGARSAPQALVEAGRQLWTTMGQMQPEDVAEFEQRRLSKDEC